MHELYEKVLRERYGQLAVRTQESVRKFYRTLPAPSELSEEWVRDRLRPLAPQTQWSYRSFLKALEKDLGRDLTSKIHPPRPRSHVQKTDLYTKNELVRIFEACIDTRDRAMFQVLYESGVRASELVGLRIADVRPGQRLWWLNVLGKGGKERPVPILHSAPSLQAWLDVSHSSHWILKNPVLGVRCLNDSDCVLHKPDLFSSLLCGNSFWPVMMISSHGETPTRWTC